MAEEETVTVTLPKAIVWRNKAYGPGRDIEVPKRAAEAHGLTSTEASDGKKAAKRGTK